MVSALTPTIAACLRRVLILIALKIVRFDGAALRHVFRIEIQHDPLAFEIFQADRLTFLRLQREVRRLTAHCRNFGSLQGREQRERRYNQR